MQIKTLKLTTFLTKRRVTRIKNPILKPNIKRLTTSSGRNNYNKIAITQKKIYSNYW